MNIFHPNVHARTILDIVCKCYSPVDSPTVYKMLVGEKPLWTVKGCLFHDHLNNSHTPSQKV